MVADPKASEAEQRSPTLARRILLLELNRLQKESGRSVAEIAREMGVDDGTLGRWLDGKKQNLRPADLVPLLMVYGYDRAHPMTQQLIKLALDARQRGIAQDRRPWMEKFRFDLFVGLERGASKLTDVETSIVPGLLQTPDYAEAALRATVPDIEAGELAERVAMRMDRQKILRRSDPLHLTAVLDEAVLHRAPADPTAMRAQLDHLLTMADLPHIDVLVVPFRSGLSVGGESGSFVLMEFTNGVPPVAYSETPAQALYVEEEAGILRYRAVIAQLTEDALAGQAAADLIGAAQEHL